MVRRVGLAAAGLTLLEAVIALAILGLVAGAVLEARAMAAREARASSEMQRSVREIESIFRMLTTRTLGRAERVGGGASVWTGEHLGEPYEVLRREVVVENPARRAVDVPIASELELFEYTISYGGAREVFLWHR